MLTLNFHLFIQENKTNRQRTCLVVMFFVIMCGMNHKTIQCKDGSNMSSTGNRKLTSGTLDTSTVRTDTIPFGQAVKTKNSFKSGFPNSNITSCPQYLDQDFFTGNRGMRNFTSSTHFMWLLKCLSS